MKEMTLTATLENLAPVQEFIEGELSAHGCPAKTVIQISVAVEEIYVNIAHYAYAPQTGDVTVRCDVGGEPPCATIQFEDAGVPFDPLARPDADITLSAAERKIGGLGILMVKRTMDDVRYARVNDRNILTLQKRL